MFVSGQLEISKGISEDSETDPNFEVWFLPVPMNARLGCINPQPNAVKGWFRLKRLLENDLGLRRTAIDDCVQRLRGGLNYHADCVKIDESVVERLWPDNLIRVVA
jgi:hypothetical protein